MVAYRLLRLVSITALAVIVTSNGNTALGDIQCPFNEKPVSVESGAISCAPVPICSGKNITGNCPTGSGCGITKNGVAGCIILTDKSLRANPSVSATSTSSSAPSTTDNSGSAQPTNSSPSGSGSSVNFTETPTTKAAATVTNGDLTTNSNNPIAPTSNTSPNTSLDKDLTNAPSTTPTKPNDAGAKKTMTLAFSQLLVDQHNLVRSWHGLNPVVWDVRAAATAQDFANTCPGQVNGQLGWENMATAPYDTDELSDLLTQVNPVWLWYSKQQGNWNYQSNSCTPGPWETCGLFSNMLSPSVEKIGCGSSICASDSFVWCVYVTSEENPKIPAPKGQQSDLCSQLYSCQAPTNNVPSSNILPASSSTPQFIDGVAIAFNGNNAPNNAKAKKSSSSVGALLIATGIGLAFILLIFAAISWNAEQCRTCCGMRKSKDAVNLASYDMDTPKYSEGASDWDDGASQQRSTISETHFSHSFGQDNSSPQGSTEKENATGQQSRFLYH